MASASGPTTETSFDRPLCGARTRSDGSCRNAAGAGTDHPGVGACKFHGGCTPSHQRAAARYVAESLAVELDVEPHEALLWMVNRAATQVAFWASQVALLEPDALIVSQVRERIWSGGENAGGVETITSTHAELHIKVRALIEAEERLAKTAKMALDAGVEERRVRVVEQLGQQLGDFIQGVLAELDLTAEQRRRAPAVIDRRLRILEGGAVVEAA